VISRETVRICFMLAALNELNIMMGDVGNAFIQAKPREKCNVIITDDQLFGPSAVGSKTVIVRALYGMKSSGAAWRETLAIVLKKELWF